LTPYKVLNIILINFSYYLSRISGKYLFFGKPHSISIEPSSVCNMSCKQCPVGKNEVFRKEKFLDITNFKDIINQVKNHSCYLMLYFQGESLLNIQILEMVNYAFKKRMFSVINTNGYKLDNQDFADKLVNSRPGRIIISLDGITEDSYKKYRQDGDFNKTLKGIENLVNARNNFSGRGPIIDIQFLVMKHNQHEIKAVKKLVKDMGVNRLLLKSPQIYDFFDAENILPDNKKFRRYKIVDGKYVLKNKLSAYCKRLWISSVISSDQLVVPCCFDKQAEYPFGDLKNNTFHEIWVSEKYSLFRKSVINDRSSISICCNCTE